MGNWWLSELPAGYWILSRITQYLAEKGAQETPRASHKGWSVEERLFHETAAGPGSEWRLPSPLKLSDSGCPFRHKLAAPCLLLHTASWSNMAFSIPGGIHILQEYLWISPPRILYQSVGPIKRCGGYAFCLAAAHAILHLYYTVNCPSGVACLFRGSSMLSAYKFSVSGPCHRCACNDSMHATGRGTPSHRLGLSPGVCKQHCKGLWLPGTRIFGPWARQLVL